MKSYLSIAVFLSASAISSEAFSTEDKALTKLEALKAIRWEVGALSANAFYLGVKSWDWGSSDFNVNNEGWFELDTGSGGADKLGHLYTSYAINEFFNTRLNNHTTNKRSAARNSAIFSSAVMFGVEVFDGFSDDHGFSYEDIVMNTLGIGVSYLKNTRPGLDEKLDLRIEYSPTNENSGKPFTDYSGYTYIAALKLGGFKRFKATPLKYFELQLGYHTEGFKSNETNEFPEAKTELQFGIGLNLSEVLFNKIDKDKNRPIVQSLDTFFQYYRAPYTSISTTIDERTR